MRSARPRVLVSPLYSQLWSPAPGSIVDPAPWLVNALLVAVVPLCYSTDHPERNPRECDQDRRPRMPKLPRGKVSTDLPIDREPIFAESQVPRKTVQSVTEAQDFSRLYSKAQMPNLFFLGICD